MRRLIGLFAALLLSFSVQAAIESYAFETPEQEAAYSHLIQELRCLVCQNQNLADSNADLAKDLRREVHKMVTSGQGVDQVVDFMVARYGDFVLYRPPVQSNTMLLWGGPFALLAVGLLVLAVFLRHRSRDVAPSLNQQQRAQVRELLDDAPKSAEPPKK
jgi:cytochrome c-type biogenesis protein CcmH